MILIICLNLIWKLRLKPFFVTKLKSLILQRKSEGFANIASHNGSPNEALKSQIPLLLYVKHINQAPTNIIENTAPTNRQIPVLICVNISKNVTNYDPQIGRYQCCSLSKTKHSKSTNNYPERSQEIADTSAVLCPRPSVFVLLCLGSVSVGQNKFTKTEPGGGRGGPEGSQGLYD